MSAETERKTSRVVRARLILGPASASRMRGGGAARREGKGSCVCPKGVRGDSCPPRVQAAMGLTGWRWAPRPSVRQAELCVPESIWGCAARPVAREVEEQRTKGSHGELSVPDSFRACSASVCARGVHFHTEASNGGTRSCGCPINFGRAR